MCITDKLFASECGREIYSGALSAISDFSMKPLIKGGTVLGFSGGADSVMLLLFLIKYRSEIGDFPIVAVHINHGIRGKEADEDEEKDDEDEEEESSSKKKSKKSKHVDDDDDEEED